MKHGFVTLIKVLGAVNRPKGKVSELVDFAFPLEAKEAMMSPCCWNVAVCWLDVKWDCPPSCMNGLPYLLQVVILNFVQVMYWFSGFRFMIKSLSPFLLGVRKGYVKNPSFPGPNSIVPSDSIELTSDAIILSWVFGTCTSHLLVGFIKGGSDWSVTDALVLCPTQRGPGLYPSILL